MHSTTLLQNISNDNFLDFNISKSDEEKRLVFGWALVSATADGQQIIDHQGDIVDQDELEEGAYEYVLNFRDAGEEHIGTLRKKARMVESVVFTEEKLKAMGIPLGTVPYGWWIGFYVDDDDTWEKIKSGHYKMFSIEGKAVREPVDEPLAKNAFDEWLEDNLDKFKTEKDEIDFANWKSEFGTPKNATDVDVVDMIYSEYRKNTVAKTFNEILKFNPYHDSKGRFTSGSGGFASFSANPNTKAGKLAIERASEQHPLIGFANGTNTRGKAKEPDSDSKNDKKDDIKTMESQFNKLGEQMAQMAQYATPGPNYDSSKASKYYEIKRQYNELRSKINAKKDEEARNRPKQNTNSKYVNGYGEATHRNITTSTYERAQRRLNREIDRWLGIK